jgi:hypothetical protein
MAAQKLQDISERDHYPITIRFAASNGVARIPATARWNLYCLTTRKEILGWQTIPATAAEVEIDIPSSANIIQREGNTSERKLLTAQANPGTEEQFSYQAEYIVRSSPAY